MFAGGSRTFWLGLGAENEVHCARKRDFATLRTREQEKGHGAVFTLHVNTHNTQSPEEKTIQDPETRPRRETNFTVV